MTLALLFVVKILDNIIMTIRTIAIYKGQKVFTTFLTIISQLMFYFIIKQVVQDDSVLTICVISGAAGFGNYFGFLISDKYKKDVKYTNMITSSNVDGICSLNDYMVEHGVKCFLHKGLNRNRSKETYILMIVSKTKEQSRLIDGFLALADWEYVREGI